MEVRKGILKNFIGNGMSGLATLIIEDSKTGITESVMCDNGPTVRALESCFGNVITEGHTANGDGYKGKEIYWSMDELDLCIGGFSPVCDHEEWDGLWENSEDGVFEVD